MIVYCTGWYCRCKAPAGNILLIGTIETVHCSNIREFLNSRQSTNPWILFLLSFAYIWKVLNEELFGQVAEEKEVEGIKGKVPEARSSKSFDSYHILALYITKSSLPKIIVPLKQVWLLLQ